MNYDKSFYCRPKSDQKSSIEENRCEGSINITNDSVCYSVQCYSQKPSKVTKISRNQTKLTFDTKQFNVKEQEEFHICDLHVRKIPFKYLLESKQSLLSTKDPLEQYFESVKNHIENEKLKLKSHQDFINKFETLRKEIRRKTRNDAIKNIRNLTKNMSELDDVAKKTYETLQNHVLTTVDAVKDNVVPMNTSKNITIGVLRQLLQKTDFCLSSAKRSSEQSISIEVTKYEELLNSIKKKKNEKDNICEDVNFELSIQASGNTNNLEMCKSKKEQITKSTKGKKRLLDEDEGKTQIHFDTSYTELEEYLKKLQAYINEGKTMRDKLREDNLEFFKKQHKCNKSSQSNYCQGMLNFSKQKVNDTIYVSVPRKSFSNTNMSYDNFYKNRLDYIATKEITKFLFMFPYEEPKKTNISSYGVEYTQFDHAKTFERFDAKIDYQKNVEFIFGFPKNRTKFKFVKKNDGQKLEWSWNDDWTDQQKKEYKEKVQKNLLDIEYSKFNDQKPRLHKKVLEFREYFKIE